VNLLGAVDTSYKAYNLLSRSLQQKVVFTLSLIIDNHEVPNRLCHRCLSPRRPSSRHAPR